MVTDPLCLLDENGFDTDPMGLMMTTKLWSCGSGPTRFPSESFSIESEFSQLIGGPKFWNQFWLLFPSKLSTMPLKTSSLSSQPSSFSFHKSVLRNRLRPDWVYTKPELEFWHALSGWFNWNRNFWNHFRFQLNRNRNFHFMIRLPFAGTRIVV